MRVRYHDHGLVNDEVRHMVDRELRVLERRLMDFAVDLRHLNVGLDHRLGDDSYSAKLVLNVPNRQIAASGHGARRSTAVREAFSHLKEELDRYLAKLRNEPGERAEAKFHLSAQELHKGALREIYHSPDSDEP